MSEVSTPAQPAGGAAAPPNAAPQFVSAYQARSLSPATQARFRNVHDKIMALARRHGRAGARFDVLDIGCGAGTHCGTCLDRIEEIISEEDTVVRVG